MTSGASDLRCPKAMRYGPCGGVRTDGSCEVDVRPCPFLEVDLPPVPGPVRPLTVLLPPPVIVVDVRAPARWDGQHRHLWRATAQALQGCVALLGEHVDNTSGDAGSRIDSGALPATEVIAILREANVEVIATVTGRDRDLSEAATVMEAYRDAGASAIHCVTGDHPAALGLARPARFGAEAISLVGTANRARIAATVGESPASPGRRAARLAAKQTAGAAMCLLNHGGDVDGLSNFVIECRAAGVTVPFIAPVPMVADRRAALGLANFPGLRLPHGFIDEILEATDPVTAGLRATHSFIHAVVEQQCFAGVNLSGSAGGIDPWERLQLTSRFVDEARRALLTP